MARRAGALVLRAGQFVAPAMAMAGASVARGAPVDAAALLVTDVQQMPARRSEAAAALSRGAGVSPNPRHVQRAPAAGKCAHAAALTCRAAPLAG
jgi:hypothetical protein